MIGPIRLWSLLCLVLCAQSMAATTVASVCGYEVSEHSPEYVIGRIATAAFDDPNLGFHFPTIASLSLRQKADSGPSQELLLSVNDGTIRTGAARFSNGQVHFLDSDAQGLGTVQDVAVIGVHLEKIVGRFLSPCIAINDGDGHIQILVATQTKLAGQIAAAFRGRNTADYVSLVLPTLHDQPFRSVDMVQTSPGEVRVFGLTDAGLYSIDLKMNELNVTQLPEWEGFIARPAGRFVRAFNDQDVVIADELGKIDLFKGTRKISLGVVSGGWLTSISAFQVGGEYRLATLSNSFTTPTVPSINLWDGLNFRRMALEFSEGEKPVALAYSGMRPNSLAEWLDVRSREELRTGYLTEDVGAGELRRLLVMTRQGMNYQFRGVVGMTSDTARLSNFPWSYIGPNYTKLETFMVQAGFNMRSLRETVSVEDDIGAFGEKLKTRLVDGYGFEPFNGKKPETYKGDIGKLLEAWKRRLNALRDLRLSRAQVASSISSAGIISKKDQLLVYELMDMEDWEENVHDDGGPNLTTPLGVLNDHQWLSRFRARLSDQSDVLNVATHQQYAKIKAFYDRYLKDQAYADVERQNFNALPDPVRILYLFSRHYVGKPFKYQVSHFLEFCKLSGVDKADDPELFWQTLSDYLDSVDPLRRVVDDESLIQFLTADPT